MNRFVWLVRREVWEHKAIWIAPAIVIAVLLVAVFTMGIQLGPIGVSDVTSALGQVPLEKQTKLLLVIYTALAVVMFLVMGVIGFFYSLDSLYADRRDRSVLFWKSMPVSDTETVLAKFATAAVVIPAVAVVGALAAQLVIAAGGSAKLWMADAGAAIMWQPAALLASAGIALLWAVTAALWYAPVIAYLMLASAWAPRGPFLWAVLPPASLAVLEKVLLHSEYVGDLIGWRLVGMYELMERQEHQLKLGGPAGDVVVDGVDLHASLLQLYGSPGLWLGLAAAAALLAAAIWVRRYRDETT